MDQTALRRDHEPGRIGVQRLGDLELVDVRPVRVGRVDQRDAELDDSPQHRERALPVVGPADDPGAAQAHRAVAEASHLELAGERERSRRH